MRALVWALLLLNLGYLAWAWQADRLQIDPHGSVPAPDDAVELHEVEVGPAARTADD